MPTPSHRQARRAALLAACLGIAMSAAPAIAQESRAVEPQQTPGQRLVLDYDLYSSGFLMAGFQADVYAWPDRYDILLNGETRGILSLLGDWTATMRATGAIDRAAERLSPDGWAFQVDADGDLATRTIQYGSDGRAYATLEPPRPGLTPVPDEDLLGALDPLSAIVGAALVTDGEHCPPRQEIFDGTRRFDIAFLRIRPTTIDGSSVGGYSGFAVECEARIIPVSGHFRDPSSSSFWRYNRPDDDPGRMAMRVWFAALTEGGPPVLVRGERRGQFGNFYLHLVARSITPLVSTAEQR
ncbi:MAG: DUF3108 domain-containing protein [Azospirillaceae bacterium]